MSEEQPNELAQLCGRGREILIRDHVNADVRVLKKFPHNFGVGRLSLRVCQIAACFPMLSAQVPK